jgi:hypothetical protein
MSDGLYEAKALMRFYATVFKNWLLAKAYSIPWSFVAFYGWSSLFALGISYWFTNIARNPEIRVKIHSIPEITAEARYGE